MDGEYLLGLSLVVSGSLMHGEDTVFEHVSLRVIGQWAGIDGTFDIAADGGIFRLGVGDADWSSLFDESEKLGSDVDVHADTSVGAWAVFHPASMDSVIGSEFTPVWHGRSFEAPAGGFFIDVGFFDIVSAIGKSMAVGAVVVIFLEDAEVSFGGRSAGCAHGDGSHHQDFGAFIDVNHLVVCRNLDADVGRICRKCRRDVERIVGAHADPAFAGWCGGA